MDSKRYPLGSTSPTVKRGVISTPVLTRVSMDGRLVLKPLGLVWSASAAVVIAPNTTSAAASGTHTLPSAYSTWLTKPVID